MTVTAMPYLGSAVSFINPSLSVMFRQQSGYLLVLPFGNQDLIPLPAKKMKELSS